jgi:hypothetical protein
MLAQRITADTDSPISGSKSTVWQCILYIFVICITLCDAVWLPNITRQIACSNAVELRNMEKCLYKITCKWEDEIRNSEL